MPNLHDLPIGDGFPALVNVVIEIPPGARTKYEYDPHLGVFTLDRVLHAVSHNTASRLAWVSALQNPRESILQGTKMGHEVV
jgi:hypothetical protein